MKLKRTLQKVIALGVTNNPAMIRNAAPSRLSRKQIAAWAGPWLVDERWWDPARRRRLARCQVVTADGAAHLVVLEQRQWWLTATYD